MLGLQTGLQRIVGSHALRGVCALQAAQRDAVVGLQNGACGQFDVFQQRQVGGAVILAFSPKVSAREAASFCSQAA